MAQQAPAHLRDRIVHASLQLGWHELLGVDVMPGDYHPPADFFVLMSFPDAEHARRVFAALSQ